MLSPLQARLVESDLKLYLEGPAGVGKTTVLTSRLHFLLDDSHEDAVRHSVAPPSIDRPELLVLVPERSKIPLFQSITEPFQLRTLASEGERKGGHLEPVVSTFYQLAREGVTAYWPMIAAQAGFHDPQSGPTWLTYDMAQIVMWEIVTPMLSMGYFADLRLRPQQIISQLLDNLRRAAFNRISVEEAIGKQLSAWAGDAEHQKQLLDARRAAQAFQARCLELNLLDTSMIISIFDRYIFQNEPLFAHFTHRFKHLLVDNLEEQTPLGQAFIERMLEMVDSAQLAYDNRGGYKRLLSASPLQASTLKARCDDVVELNDLFGIDADMFQIARRVEQRLGQEGIGTEVSEEIEHLILDTVRARYRREMVELIGPRLARMLAETSIQPSNVAIIIPYLDGALQFKLIQSLEEAGLPYELARRRSTPREEPLIRAWITWLRLAFYEWPTAPSLYDVSEAFSLTIQGLDPVRASLLADKIYDPLSGRLLSVDALSAEVEERIGEGLMATVKTLVSWLDQYSSRELPYADEIDFFFYYLFDELLTQPGFFIEEERLEAAAVCRWLIDLATRLKQLGGDPQSDTDSHQLIGMRFIDGIYNGLVSSDPPTVTGDTEKEEEGIFIGSIQGFLLSERQVDVQVWLEVSGNGWWDLPRQPLSNPFVLDSQWSNETTWTMADDARIRNELLVNIVQGLCGRCRKGIVLTLSDLDRRGARQDGPLWRALI